VTYNGGGITVQSCQKKNNYAWVIPAFWFDKSGEGFDVTVGRRKYRREWERRKISMLCNTLPYDQGETPSMPN
jgi:hypothetical protein